MSTVLKWIAALIVIAGLAWLVWWSGWLGGTTPSASQAAAVNTATSTSTTPAVAQPTNGMSTPSDTSDAGLSQDTAAVDAQMKAYSADSDDVNASMSDAPVSQSY